MGINPLQTKPAAYAYPPERFVAAANAGDDLANYFLHCLLKDGVTAPLVEVINGRLASVRKGVHVRENRKTGRIETHDVWLLDHPPTGAEGVTLAFVEFLKTGAFQKLKVCSADDCNNYHFRRGKWCSDTCGGRQRVRKKRKLDKQRQML